MGENRSQKRVPDTMDSRDDAAVKLLQELVRIPSTSHLGPSSGSYAACVALLDKECKERGFKTQTYELIKGKPILLATLEGTDPSLPSLLLNSHYDVVPADEALWTLAKPFSADIVDGNIVGRGTQDMKCVCVQHLEALGRASKAGQLLRTVHISFVPDEEIGGEEGLGNPEAGTNTVFYGERANFWIRIKAKGNVGHGSHFVKDQAVPKVLAAVEQFLAFRAEQEAKFEGHGCKHGVAHKLGDLVTLNCTMLNAGVTSDHGESYALNVIPSTAEAGFDIRIPPSVGIDEMEAKIKSWCDPDGIEIEFVAKVPEHNVSDISDSNPWWKVFTNTFDELNVKIVPEIFPAGTDSRFLRAAGIPAFGFSPMSGTPILLHDNDERLGIDRFVEGIGIFERLIVNMANAPEKKEE